MGCEPELRQNAVYTNSFSGPKTKKKILKRAQNTWRNFFVSIYSARNYFPELAFHPNEYTRMNAIISAKMSFGVK